MADCIFCKIAAKELDSNIAHEDERFLVFHDIYPKAPLHLLIIPKRHIESINHLKEEDKELAGELLLTAKKMAEQNNLEGYKLQINVGKKGGQEVDHVHLHLLANKEE